MKRQITSLLPLLALLLGIHARADCKHRILFIPQLHMDQLGGQTSSQLVEMIAEVQFKIAQELVLHKQTPIFSEGTYTAITLDWYRSNADHGDQTISEYRKAFPIGLPASYGEMNSDQKVKLAEAGADLFLLFLGQIDEIYPVVTDAQPERKYFEKAQTWIKNHPGQDLFSDPEMLAIGATRRERLALEQINRLFAANPNQKHAVLIFGAAHEFQKYPDLFDPSCIDTSAPIKQAVDTVH